jgi:hypothetical protein
MYVSRDIVARSRNKNICCGKAVITKYSEPVPAALITRHAKRIRRITFSSVAGLALHIFPHFHINGKNSEKNY